MSLKHLLTDSLQKFEPNVGFIALICKMGHKIVVQSVGGTSLIVYILVYGAKFRPLFRNGPIKLLPYIWGFIANCL